MTRTLFRVLCIAALVFAIPKYSFADKFFEDNDAFFFKYLKQGKYSIDTSASAIVLYECINFDMNTWIYKIRKVVKIVKKSGSEYGNIAITSLNYNQGDDVGKITGIRGTTYNLDGEKIIKRKIDKDNLAIESTNRMYEKKIAMPEVHEGSIIDYSYEIQGVNISKWNIQEAIPKLYTRFELCIPPIINITTDDQIVPVFIKKNEDKKNDIDSLLPFSYTFEGSNAKGLMQQCWVRRNVQAFENEPYLPCESNYCEKMLVYINSIHYLGDHGILNNWDEINKQLVENYHFFRAITEWNTPIKEKSKELAGNDTSDINIAKKIFKFVRDSISLNKSTSLFSDRDLAKILNAGSGTSAEMNLLLIALLRHQNLSCSPVILATKDNATPTGEKAEFIKYNHVICLLRLNGKKYYLDASEKYNPFGRIPPYCLNGYARVIDKNKQDTCGVTFTPDMEKEKALYSVTTTNSDIDNYTLNFKLYYGDDAAIDKRTEWNDDTTKIKKYVLSFLKDMTLETKLIQYRVYNLNDPEKQLTLDFSVSIAWPKEKGATVYLNPYFINFFGTNPFKDAKRKYPVELPGTQNLTYTLNLKLPDGFEIDEMPKSGIIKIDGTDQYKNMLDYNKDNNTLSIDSRLQMQHIFYPVNEYDVLKEFFQKMGDEQQKTLVIKKLK